MGLGIGTLVKMARGGFSAEEALELARGMGCNLQFEELTPGQRPAAFQRAASGAVRTEAKVMAVSGTDAQGNRIEALLVVVPVEKAEKKA